MAFLTDGWWHAKYNISKQSKGDRAYYLARCILTGHQQLNVRRMLTSGVTGMFSQPDSETQFQPLFQISTPNRNWVIIVHRHLSSHSPLSSFLRPIGPVPPILLTISKSYPSKLGSQEGCSFFDGFSCAISVNFFIFHLFRANSNIKVHKICTRYYTNTIDHQTPV